MDWNNFRGAAKRIEDHDISRIAASIDVGEDEIHAFMDVEAAGSGFDKEGRPKMLFEPHVFYRNLSGADRQRAVAAGLAYAKWGTKSYPRDSYPRLVQALAIDETAALKSASWGLGQILGENHRMVGHSTVQAMVRAFMDDEEEHLQAIVAFLISAGLADDLKAHNWTAVARGYNGPAHAKHNYAGRMKKAYEKWSKIKDTPSKETPMPKARQPRVKRTPGIAEQNELGSTDNILWVQKRLRELGYPEVGNVDGKMGKRTEAAILAFRNDRGLPLTKGLDDQFIVALTKAPRRKVSLERANATAKDLGDSPGIQIGQWIKIVGGVAGALGVGGGALDAVTEDRSNQVGVLIDDSLARVDNTLQTVDRLNGVVNTILDIGPWIGMSILGLMAAFLGYKAVSWSVKRYRSGNHV